MAEIKIGYLGHVDRRPDRVLLGNAVISETPDASSNILLDGLGAASGDVLGPASRPESAVRTAAADPGGAGPAARHHRPGAGWAGRDAGLPPAGSWRIRHGRGPDLTQSGGSAADDGVVADEPKATRPAVGTIAEAFAASLGGAEGQGLVPPAFSYFGYAPSMVPISADMSYPEFKKKKKRASRTTRSSASRPRRRRGPSCPNSMSTGSTAAKTRPTMSSSRVCPEPSAPAACWPTGRTTKASFRRISTSPYR